jgi:hypothetical protein
VVIGQWRSDENQDAVNFDFQRAGPSRTRLISFNFLLDFFAPMSKAQSPSRFSVILAFGLVYLFWGSTYLAIDIAVQSIPPALMCGVRFSIAGVVMLTVCAATGRIIWYSARQIALAAVVGILLLMGGNLTLSWA